LSMGYGEMQKIIAEKEPPKPSTRLSTMQHEERTVVAKNRSMEVSALGKVFQGDLDWIVMKALEKDRTHRYETVNGLVSDIRRHLDNEPVSAAAPTFSYQLHKFYRRNRKYTRVAVVVAGLLVLATGFATVQAIRAKRAEQRATRASIDAKAAQTEAQLNAKQAARLQRQAETSAEELRVNNYFQSVALAYQEISANRPFHALKLLNDCPKDLRGWEWKHLRHRALTVGQPVTRFPAPIYGMAVSPNGRDVALFTEQARLQLGELTPEGTLERFHELGPLPPSLFDARYWCVFSPDARWLAAASTNGIVNLWNVEDRTLKKSFKSTTNGIVAIAFHPSGGEIAVATKEDAVITIWDVTSEEVIRRLSVDAMCFSLAYSPDGRWLAEGVDDQKILIWETSSWKPVTELHYQSPVSGLAFSPDKRWLAGGSETTIKLWDVSTWESVHTLEGHTALITTVAFTPDGSRLISSGDDREIKIWEPFKGREILSLAGHTNSVFPVTVTRSGRLISGSLDGTARVWETSELPDQTEPVTLTGHTNRVFSLAFDPQRPGRLVSVGEDHQGLVWDTREHRQIDSFPGIFDIKFSSDGRHMISPNFSTNVDARWAVEERNANSLELTKPFPREERYIFSADISVDGNWVAEGNEQGVILILNRKTRTRSAVLLGHSKNGISAMRFSPDGRYLVSVEYDGRTLRWDATRLTEPPEGFDLLPPTAARDFSRIGFSPDGSLLASGDGFEGISILNVETGEELRHIERAHGGIVWGVAFSPNGRWLASCGTDNIVRLWNAETGELLRTLTGHSARVNDVAFSPDGRMVASCGLDQTVKLWMLDLDFQ